MVVGAVLDQEGRPICCALWPGNTSDAKTLIPIVGRLQARFHIRRICIVADRGMISKQTIQELQKAHRSTRFILGARLRAVKEIREQVPGDAGPHQEVHGPRVHSKDPSPLKVKEVRIADRRYLVCCNEERVRKDRGASRLGWRKCPRDVILSGAKNPFARLDASLRSA